MIREKIVEKIFAIEVLQDLTTLQEACISKPGLFVVEPVETLVHYFKAIRGILIDPPPKNPPYPIYTLRTAVLEALSYRETIPNYAKEALHSCDFFDVYSRLYTVLEEVHSLLEENSDQHNGYL